MTKGVGAITLAMVASAFAMAIVGCVTLDGTEFRPATEGKDMLVSPTVKVNEVEFQSMADAVWHVPERGAESDVNLGIRITNRSDTKLRVNLFDTVRIAITSPRGDSLLFDGGRNATKAGEPVSQPLAPGESLIISRRAQLKWIGDGQSLRLIGSDDFGGIWYFDRLGPGEYTLSFEYENKIKDPNDVPPIWVGKVRTSRLEVQIK
jgi:hypothetical protein